jgi:hypothetical protein
VGTKIYIKRGGDELVRIDGYGYVSSLSRASAASAIAHAMVKFAGLFNPAAGEQARKEISGLRVRNAELPEYVQAISLMIRDMNAMLQAPSIDIDVADWVEGAGGN